MRRPAEKGQGSQKILLMIVKIVNLQQKKVLLALKKELALTNSLSLTWMNTPTRWQY